MARTLHGRGEGERATPSLLPSSASWPVELDEDVLDPGAPPPTVAELRSMIRAYYESWRANGGSSKDDIAPLKRIHHCFNQLWAAEFGANEASGLQAGTAAKEGAAGFTVKSVAVEATAAGKTDASGDDPGTVPPESLKSLTAGEASCILTAARRGVMSPLPLPRAERRLKRTIERLDQLHGADVLQLRKFHTMLLLWHSYPGEGGRFNRAEAMLDAAMREGTWHPTQMTRDLLLALYCIEYGAAKGLEWLTEKEGGWQVMVDLRAEERGSWFETEKAGAVGEKTWKPGPIKPFKRTVFTYAELVKAFVAENKIDNALRCVKSMREEGLSPDCIIWTVLTKAYVYRNDLASAERCFDAMIASGIKPHRISYESIIYGLLNLTRPRRPTEDARRKDSSTSPAAIAAKERRGVEKAMALFNQMVDKDGMKPGVVMYYQFLNLHFRKGDLEKVKELFASMQANGVEPDQYCYTSLLQTYMEEVRPDRAEKLLAEMMSKGMEKNIFVYSILMHGYARAGDLEKALATYREMRERGIYPTYQCMCILLYAHCYNGDITGARLVMEEMRDSGMVVGLVAYNTLMQGLGIAGDLHAAGELYYDMMRHAIQPAVTTYNTLISAHLKAEDIDGAMRWYDSLLESGEEPTLVTFNLLVKAQAQRLNVMGAMEVVQRLRDRGHTPDAASLAPIVTAHVARSEWAEARWIAREMKGLDARGQLQQFTSRERGVVGRNPTAVANTFIKGHTMGGRLGEALREYEVIMGESVVAGGELIQRNRPLRGEKEMQERLVERGDREQEAVDFKDEKVLPDVRTFDMIIRAFGIMGDTESAERWMEEALKRDNIRPDTRLYNALLQGYVYKGDSEGAVKTYNAIMARGLHPDIFTYTLLFKAHERNRYLSSRKAEEDAKEEDVMDPRGGQVLAEAIGLAAGVVDSSGSAARADSDDGSTTWISEMEGESEGGQL
ncbi:hypothetical protein HK101_002792 [Irineochytrium annulatum]|nr:hypothetical protein HK101_002792 [Irineochytrium annulatum]